MINDKLRELRLENKKKKKDLAKLLNVSNKTVSHWESGYTEPPIYIIVSIKKIFNVSYEDLLEDE